MLIPNADIERPRSLLPDRTYALKVLARQAPYVIAIFAIFTPVALLVGLQQHNDYISYVAAIYDNRDSPEYVPRYPFYPRFAQVAEAFRIRMTEPDFLWEVGHDSGLTKVHPGPGPVAGWIRNHVPLGSTFFAMGSERDLPNDPATKSAFADWLRKHVSQTSDDKKNTLALTATFEDPTLARDVATAAMEHFIQGELTYEAETFQRQHEVYAAYLGDATKDASARRQAAQAKQGNDKDKAATAKGQEAQLRDHEAELLDRIGQVKSDLDGERARIASQRDALAADLARLSTKLQPSHPDVIAKQEELQAFDRGHGDSNAEALRSKLAMLRDGLSEVHSEMRKLGLTVVAAEPQKDGSLQRGQFLPNLEDRVGELGLEGEDIARQVASPELRTRLRVFVPATYDLIPASRSRTSTTIGLLVLGAFAALGAGLVRELRCPLARDAWRVASRVDLPILTELSRWVLKKYPSISPQLAGIMRESSLAKPGRQNAAGDVLYAYRRLELELRRRLKGNVVLVLGAGPGDRSGAFVANFLNVSGAGTPGVQLLIDCDLQDPAVPADQRHANKGDLGAFLAGRVAWKDIRLGRTAERAFDLVPPAPGAPDDQKAYRGDTLTKLFEGLSKAYGRVYIRAHDPRQVFENAALAAAVTDVVVCVDGRHTGFADVGRALAVAPADKVRGLVMVGT